MLPSTIDRPTSGETDHRWLRHYDAGIPSHLEYPHIPIYQLLNETAHRYPERTCAIFFGRHFTYRQINELSDSFAAGLQRLGIRPGERLALLLPNSPQYLIVYYGALKAGAILVPLNPLYTTHELARHLTDSDSQTIVTLPLFVEKVAGLLSKTPLKRIIVSRMADVLPFPQNVIQSYREFNLMRSIPKEGLIELQTMLSPVPAFTPPAIDPDSMAMIIYSGGTTGTAKGVMLSHFHCIASALQIKTWGHLVQPRVLAVLPLFHGFGMNMTMNAPIMAGGEIILLPRFKASDVLKAIQRYRPAFFVGVPTMFAAFNSLPDMEHYDLTSIEGIFVGAAPLTQAVKSDFEARTGGRMIEGYGLTEVVTACMSNPYKGQHKPGSVGVPLPDMDFKIVSLDDGHDMPPGERGEIVLRGPTLMSGYYKNPEETARSMVDGWFHTGDIGYMDEDGYFYVTDRKKELIIIGGFNVFPRDIDEVIYQHPKVKEGIAVGIPDSRRGERIKVFIVLRDGVTATSGEFIDFFKERLAAYKVPSEVEFRKELPKSMIGKIMRRILREEEIARIEAKADIPANQPKGRT